MCHLQGYLGGRASIGYVRARQHGQGRPLVWGDGCYLVSPLTLCRSLVTFALAEGLTLMGTEDRTTGHRQRGWALDRSMTGFEARSMTD